MINLFNEYLKFKIINYILYIELKNKKKKKNKHK